MTIPARRGIGGLPSSSAGRLAESNVVMAPSAARPGRSIVVKDAEGNEFVANTVRQVGTKTFYFEEDRWIDAAVEPGPDAKAVIIKQFSDDFFKLAATRTPS